MTDDAQLRALDWAAIAEVTLPADGKKYDTKHCNLSAIIAVGHKSRTSRLGGRVNRTRIPGLGAKEVRHGS
jgi:hypothetical protein